MYCRVQGLELAANKGVDCRAQSLGLAGRRGDMFLDLRFRG